MCYSLILIVLFFSSLNISIYFSLLLIPLFKTVDRLHIWIDNKVGFNLFIIGLGFYFFICIKFFYELGLWSMFCICFSLFYYFDNYYCKVLATVYNFFNLVCTLLFRLYTCSHWYLGSIFHHGVGILFFHLQERFQEAGFCFFYLFFIILLFWLLQFSL